MKERQMGMFHMESQQLTDWPDGVAQIFALLTCVPVRCEYMFASKQIEYVAISWKFREIAIGDAIPYYKLDVDVDNELMIVRNVVVTEVERP